MFSNPFFDDFEPESLYSTPLKYAFGAPQRKRHPAEFASRTYGDINNNRSDVMDRQRQAYFAQLERQRQAQAERQRQQQQLRQRRPVVYRPKPYETTIDLSELDYEEIQVRFVDGDLILRAPRTVYNGFYGRRVMVQRRVPLPEDIIEDQVQCQMDRYGRLTITAPRKICTRYESDDDQDDHSEEETEIVHNLKPVPRTSSPATAHCEQSPPVGTKTDQHSSQSTNQAKTTKAKPKPTQRYEFVECDPDIIVEDVDE